MRLLLRLQHGYEGGGCGSRLRRSGVQFRESRRSRHREPDATSWPWTNRDLEAFIADLELAIPNHKFAMWDLTGHRLFLSGMAGVQAWTPESGSVNLSGAKMWQYLPGLSPDGSQVAYTGYINPLNQAAGTLRVYAYNASVNSTRLLIDQSRSEVVFIKDGWVWYLDEPLCDPTSDPGCLAGSAPSGKVFAMNLSTGLEQPVSFAPGEEPIISQGYSFSFAPGEFWPNS